MNDYVEKQLADYCQLFREQESSFFPEDFALSKVKLDAEASNSQTIVALRVKGPAITRESVLKAAANRNESDALLDLLKTDPTMKALYDTSAGGWEDYSIGEHIEMTFGRITKYPLGHSLPASLGEKVPALSLADLRAMLAVHDLGKFLPRQGREGREKSLQHARTLSIINANKDLLFAKPETVKLVNLLIDGDLLGDYFRTVLPVFPSILEKQSTWNKIKFKQMSLADYFTAIKEWENFIAKSPASPETTAQIITKSASLIMEKAKQARMMPEEFLHYQTVYYQADSSAYTYDTICFSSSTRAAPSIDYLYARNEAATDLSQPLFIFDDKEQRLLFSSPFEKAYRKLKDEVWRLS
ncbi:MAG: hypothetical protein IT292_08550 [Deltaproteobacteria bacterium]|nr:hypothetical protein [Deltaproteobacteria bacterium]